VVKTGKQMEIFGPPASLRLPREVFSLIMREQGKVKWFNSEKGYGFISRSSGDDVFVHYSALRTARSLNEGDTVEFEVVKGRKGLQAQDIVVL
jgi:CspA family cold shock protein